MATCLHRWWAPGARLARMLAVALTLAGLIRSGAVVPQETARAALDAVTILCHTGPAKSGDDLPLQRHRATDAAILQASAAAQLGCLILCDGAELPGPPVAVTGKVYRPAARAPPARPTAGFYPTGPPEAA